MVNQLKHPEDLSFSLSDHLQADLRIYQETGFKWLKTMGYYNLGAVLADDMGLGKTIQILAFLASQIEEGKGSFLVICPASVLYNWQREFEKFTPRIETLLISGEQKSREKNIRKAQERDIPIWIASYPLIQRDIEHYVDTVFSSIVLDEAQYVKNMNTKTAQAVRQIRRGQVVALSGTPIENHLGELYSLFAIVMPSLFESSKHFKSLTRQEISDKIRPFVLRRLKPEDLFDLPKKIESIEIIDMSKGQKILYQSQVDMLRQNLHDWQMQGRLISSHMNILSGLTRLRQICNDPRLIDPDYSAESAKLDRLIEILYEARENGKRIVFFSQFTKMLSLIREELDRLAYNYHYLDGSTKAEKRLQLANQFNRGDKDIFLISLKAGGAGLNLTGGDTVILYDSWWNPAVDDQAADRVHRFGQKKAVQVIRMISKGTIEERIYDLQEEKRQVIESVIDSGGDNLISRLTREELMALIES